MTFTTGSTLTIWTVIGAVVAWAGEGLLVGSGQPALVPPLTWGVALFLLGGLVVALAWPIRAHREPESMRSPVDPFYATRVLLLAKASAIAGSILCGVGVGFLVFFLGRPVVSEPALWLSFVATVGAVVMMVAALVAERWCALPPESHTPDAQGAPEGEIS
jgi:hypothetical protein